MRARLFRAFLRQLGGAALSLDVAERVVAAEQKAGVVIVGLHQRRRFVEIGDGLGEVAVAEEVASRLLVDIPGVRIERGRGRRLRIRFRELSLFAQEDAYDAMRLGEDRIERQRAYGGFESFVACAAEPEAKGRLG